MENVEVIELLLEHNSIDMDVVDHSGKKALDSWTMGAKNSK